MPSQKEREEKASRAAEMVYTQQEGKIAEYKRDARGRDAKSKGGERERKNIKRAESVLINKSFEGFFFFLGRKSAAAFYIPGTIGISNFLFYFLLLKGGRAALNIYCMVPGQFTLNEVCYTMYSKYARILIVSLLFYFLRKRGRREVEGRVYISVYTVTAWSFE